MNIDVVQIIQINLVLKNSGGEVPADAEFK